MTPGSAGRLPVHTGVVRQAVRVGRVGRGYLGQHGLGKVNVSHTVVIENVIITQVATRRMVC